MKKIKNSIWTNRLLFFGSSQGPEDLVAQLESKESDGGIVDDNNEQADKYEKQIIEAVKDIKRDMEDIPEDIKNELLKTAKITDNLIDELTGQIDISGNQKILENNQQQIENQMSQFKAHLQEIREKHVKGKKSTYEKTTTTPNSENTLDKSIEGGPENETNLKKGEKIVETLAKLNPKIKEKVQDLMAKKNLKLEEKEAVRIFNTVSYIIDNALSYANTHTEKAGEKGLNNILGELSTIAFTKREEMEKSGKANFALDTYEKQQASLIIKKIVNAHSKKYENPNSA